MDQTSLNNVEHQHKQTVIGEINKRLDYEKAWVLHRALTLNVGAMRQEPGESWRGQNHPEDLTWDDSQRKELLTKYHALLLSL